MKIGTKIQALILVLSLSLAYVCRVDIMIGCIKLYTLTGNPHSKRIMGEYYASQAKESATIAAWYFQQALEGYKMKLPGVAADQQKWIEYLIGSQYECGKGVPADLEQAKYWYRKALDNGLPTDNSTLQHMHEALKKATSKKKKSNPPGP